MSPDRAPASAIPELDHHSEEAVMEANVDVHDTAKRAASILESFLGELRGLGPLPIDVSAIDLPSAPGLGRVRITISGPDSVVRPAREVLMDTLAWAA